MNTLTELPPNTQVTCECVCCRIDLAISTRGLLGKSATIASIVGAANVLAVPTFDVIQIAAEIDPVACRYLLRRLIADGHVRQYGDVYRLTFAPALPTPTEVQ